MKQRRERFVWRLEEVMHARGMHSIAGLQRELAARGVDLSSSQTHRLVTQKPERLNLEVLAAVCEILRCSPADLIDLTYLQDLSVAEAGGDVISLAETGRPRRAQVRRSQEPENDDAG